MTTETATGIDRESLTGEYTIDPVHSRFGIVARHAVVTKVRANFNEFEGRLRIDGVEPSKSNGEITIQAASFDSGNEQRDEHIRSTDFLLAEEHPAITFTTTGIEGDESGDHFRVTGNLSVRGTSNQVIFDVEFLGAAIDAWGNTRVGLEGTTVINRKDWGVSWNAVIEAGGVMVSEKVKLEFEIAAVKGS